MKTAEQRDAMVKRVKEAHAKWPSLDKMPLYTGGPLAARQEVKPGRYVDALYELAYLGATPVGRQRYDDTDFIVGE